MNEELEIMEFKVGYAYVPMQKMRDTYSPLEALKRGTLFPELDLPLGVYEKGVM